MAVTLGKTKFALSQRISASMSAIRGDEQLKTSPACRLLMRLTDEDFLRCHSPPYNTTMGLIAMIFLAIPVIVATSFGDNLDDSLFETLFPTLISSIFVSFCVFLSYTSVIFFRSICLIGGSEYVASLYQEGGHG
jgi:hypothetical protein